MPTKKLSGICTLHLRDFAFISVPPVLLCTLLYKSFSLSFHISEDQKKMIIRSLRILYVKGWMNKKRVSFFPLFILQCLKEPSINAATITIFS